MKTWNQLPLARASRVLIAAAAAVVLAACSTTPTAPRWQGETPGSLLWVGNSFFYFNNSMHGHLGGLLNAAGVRGIRQTSVTISGAGVSVDGIALGIAPDGALRVRVDGGERRFVSGEVSVRPGP